MTGALYVVDDFKSSLENFFNLFFFYLCKDMENLQERFLALAP